LAAQMSKKTLYTISGEERFFTQARST